MAKRTKKQARRLRNLVMICTLCAVVLTVSTYAWFIGMKTVKVSTFEVEIATTEGLFLSMDGEHWSYKLDATDEDAAYVGNTNTWAKNGLIPMSTVGDMDSTASRMKLFEKASLTTTPGGYRLLASRVGNYTTTVDDGALTQGEGYVAFDLFIRNQSGTEYYVENEPLNEEAIYLTTDSAVGVGSGGVANTGIENSVRVAFTQIGRVKDGTDADTVTKITCSKTTDENGKTVVTGICRNAQIWEPNDTKHVQNAINWYDTSCRQRKSGGTNVTATTSFEIDKSIKCGTVVDGTANKTYAVSRVLGIEDNVDIYDGATFNTYTANSTDYKTYSGSNDKSQYKLVDFPYFTDTMKNLTGTDRPTFMTLAPNSITKLRVYVYIEGQDVDNYDFASLGQKISVKFGFTKERLVGSDIGYSSKDTATLPDEVVGTPEA